MDLVVALRGRDRRKPVATPAPAGDTEPERRIRRVAGGDTERRFFTRSRQTDGHPVRRAWRPPRHSGSASDGRLPAEDLTPKHIAHFLVGHDGRRLVGVVGMEPTGDGALLRSLAVRPAHQGEGGGIKLVAKGDLRRLRRAPLRNAGRTSSRTSCWDEKRAELGAGCTCAPIPLRSAPPRRASPSPMKRGRVNRIEKRDPSECSDQDLYVEDFERFPKPLREGPHHFGGLEALLWGEPIGTTLLSGIVIDGDGGLRQPLPRSTVSFWTASSLAPCGCSPTDTHFRRRSGCLCLPGASAR